MTDQDSAWGQSLIAQSDAAELRRANAEIVRLRKLRDDLAILVDEHDDYADPRAKMEELGVILRWSVDDNNVTYTITDKNEPKR